MEVTNVIAFYSHNPAKYPKDNKWKHVFSNFSAHSVVIDGKEYPTTEHYFQCMKAKGTPREEEMRLAKTATIVKRMGGNRAYGLPKDWEETKEEYMLVALRAKFTQHKECKEALMRTGDSYLEERTSKDSYWGSGSDSEGGTGKNRLGKLLVQVREELRSLSLV